MTAEPTPELLLLIDRLLLSGPQRLGCLTIFALLGDPLPGDLEVPPIVTLKDAIDCRGLVITEVDNAGSVNRVHARNLLDRHVLLLDGDELIGAKQNRVLNASVLLGPSSEYDLDVSCIERGRWRWSSQGFGAEERTVQTSLRRLKAHRVSRSLGATGSFDANQRAVWGDVATITERRRSSSRTEALSDVLEADAARTVAPAASIPLNPGQVGLVATLGTELVSVDILGSSELYARCHHRLLRGLAAEALLHGDAAASDPSNPLATLRALVRGTPMTNASGAGVETRFHGPRGTAAALFLQGQLVHLAAFPA